MSFYVLLCLLSLLYADNSVDCQSPSVYLKAIKKSERFANEEEFVIMNGNTTVATSPAFENYSTRETTFCLPPSENYQYNLKMIDTYGDGWYNGAWLSFEGPYNNTLFKNWMIEKSEESFVISLYMPIKKSMQWRMTTTAPESSWTVVSFSDNTWTEVNLGSVSSVSAGTQFFRKSFTGLDGLASYEVRFQYKYGIIAYINGVEIWRDNMPQGSVSSTTLATGSYYTLEYRGVLRGGYEVAGSQSVLAVEIHFTESASVECDFDAWLAVYASSFHDAPCTVVPGATISSPAGSGASNAFDYSSSTYFTLYSLPGSVVFTYDSFLTPFINGISMFPQYKYYTPKSFTVAGSKTTTDYSTLMSYSNIDHENQVWSVFTTRFHGGLYKSIQLTVSSGQYSTVYLYEVSPVVCNVAPPSSIEFPQEDYEYYMVYQTVSIAPVSSEFVNCTITPSLPTGLTFDSASCSISGTPMAISPKTVYTMTSTAFGSLSGSFSLTVISCSGTMVEIVRSYKTNSALEAFTIVDAATEEILYSVVPSSSQEDNTSWSTNLCITKNRISVDIASSGSKWYDSSYIYLNAFLSVTEKEPLMQNRYDTLINNPISTVLSVGYTIPTVQEWYYKRGEFDSNWTGESTTGWLTGSYGTFQDSVNQLQFYKKNFSVDSLQNKGAVSVSLRYQYGCIIYLNGHEVFRNGVSGDLSSSSMSTHSYSSLNFHTITLPLRTLPINNTASVDYIRQGTNTIAIALVATNANQKESTFDCAVRFLGDNQVSRVFDFAAFTSGSTIASYLFDFMSSHTVYSYLCSTSYYGLRFENDRREWISSITVQNLYSGNSNGVKQFTFQARNSDSDEWTTLATVTNLMWSMKGQRNRIWILNNKPWNQYRFKDFSSGNTSNCYWGVNQADLFADDMLQTVPDLSYPTSSPIIKDIEMAEIYPNSDMYYDFTIQPTLPQGISLNPNTGVISGTSSTITGTITYTITAKRATGGTATVEYPLAVENCTNGKALMTVTIRTDSYPSEAAYNLYSGRGKTGQILKSLPELPSSGIFMYVDQCLVNGLYTFEAIDNYGDGWSIPGGYMLTLDVGQLRYEMKMVPAGSKPVSITSTFSSVLPFQCGYSDWQVYKDTADVASNWNTLEFDDSAWSSLKAASIGTSEAVTVYIRKTFTIPNLDDYVVLNVRVLYTGGVVAYFNGNRVARFNLEENYTPSSESLAVFDAVKDSRFHVLLTLSNAVAGTNVIAFEIHRPKEQSSATPVEFDATGVFGVEDCSTVLDSFSSLTGTSPSTGELVNLFDLSSDTSAQMVNAVGTYLQWTSDNLEGVAFNRYGFFMSPNSQNWGYSLYGRMDEGDEWTSISAEIGVTSISRTLSVNEVPVGIAKYKEFKWEIDSTPVSLGKMFDFVFSYCKPSGDGVCTGVDGFPTVGEGAISPSQCPYGFRGYTYRECHEGVFGEVKNDRCVHKIPANLLYSDSLFTLVLNTNVHINAPTFDNIIERFYLEENMELPAGLVLDEATGAITGIPQEEMIRKEFVIYGANAVGVVSTTITLAVRVGECKSDGVFPTNHVGELAVYECAMYGAFVGTQKRACILGAKDGEWQEIQGVCIAISSIVVVAVIVIVLIVVVVFLLLRKRSKKAVGGVKTKATKIVKKQTKETKTVKI